MNRQIYRPPQLVRWILRRISRSQEKIAVAGDLEEDFNEIVNQKNIFRARVWYTHQIFILIFSFVIHHLYWGVIMIHNYFKIAFRNIQKHKGYSFINILGLAIGLACCILLLLWVQDELDFDRFHTHSNNLYRVFTEGHYTSRVTRFSWTPAPLAEVLKEEWPEVVETSRFVNAGRTLIIHDDRRFFENGVAFADPSFFEMFTFPLFQDDSRSPFAELSSVIITEEMAEKYFGDKNPIGQSLSMNNMVDVFVTGVVQNIPLNSSIRFDFLLPLDLLIKLGGATHWGGHSYRTYVLLEPAASYKEINERLPEWVEAHTPEPVQYYLQPFTDIHLYALSGGGPILYVYIFSAIAVLIVLVACINFMNLSTARSGSRSLEVGLRKVVGACRSHLAKQFISETMILTYIAFFLSMILVAFFIPAFNTLSGKQLQMINFLTVPGISGLIVLTLLTGFVSGSYPAILLSRFQPVAALKGLLISGKRGVWFRRILVTSQFVLSIALIIGTTIVHRQMVYVKNRNLGFDKELMVCLRLRENMGQNYTTIKSELLKNPDIVSVSAGSGMPGGFIDREWGQIDWQGKDPDTVIPIWHLAIDDEYVQNFNMEIINGRNFSRTFSADTLNFILNEAAVRATGLDSPLGKQLTLLYRTGVIIGIVKDFHTFSLRNEIEPVILRMTPPRFWQFVFVRLRANQPNISKTIQFLEDKWMTYAPQYPFEYEFLDETIDRLYRVEHRMGNIINAFTILTIFIACLGLFGLASFTAEMRTKEIGIRKVLGARVAGIVLILSKEFLRLVLIANIFAWPVAYFAMKKWLQSFAYRHQIDLLSFIGPGMLALAIAVFTVSYQAVKAASANPVDSLKYE